MQREASIEAAEISAREQPIPADTSCRNTVSDIMVPTPMQLTTMPTPTITQP